MGHFGPFLALLLLYNRLLLVGYLNFLFGAALWLYALHSGFIFAARVPLRISVLSISALLIFFMHLTAFERLAVTIAIYENAGMLKYHNKTAARDK
jgi:hypothetical protein